MRLLFPKLFLLYLIFLILPFFGILSCGGGGSGSSADLNLSAQNCGNSFLNAEEACDDGNVNNSDGCNAHCAYEVGEAVCGNGVLENEECCDDGNNVSGDGCSVDCTLEKNNHPPSAPVLANEPHDMTADETGWSPTRLYLSWNPSMDSDAGDQVSYDVYFMLKDGRNNIPSSILPYKAGISSTHFIIQASTDNRAEYFPDQVSEIYLSPETSYLWKVCARDSSGAQNCSETRTFNTDDSVVGWWRFDEDPNSGAVCSGGQAGETVCDYSGHNNHGIPYGSPQWLNTNDSGMIGGALNFDGANDWVEVSNDDSLNPDSITIGAFIKPNGKISEQEIVDKRSGGAGYNMRLCPCEDVMVPFPICFAWFITQTDVSEVNQASSRIIIDRDFIYLHGSFDVFTSGESRTYFNGNLQAIDNHTGLDRTTKSPDSFRIGDRSWAAPSSFDFKGQIGEVLIWQRPLSAMEVQDEFLSVH